MIIYPDERDEPRRTELHARLYEPLLCADRRD